MQIKPISPALGAEIIDLDISKPLDDETVAALRQSLAEHCILVLRNQTLTPEQHITFSRKFGKLAEHVLQDYLLKGHPEIYVISNVKEDAKPVGRAGAGQYWHSDLSYMAKPSMGSIMVAVEVPDGRGDTLFTNMYKAYDALSDDQKKYLEDKKAIHDFAYTQQTQIAGKGLTQPASKETLAKTPPVAHPVVRTHPESRRKALYVNPGMTTHLDGVPADDSRAMLDELFEHAVRDAFTYRHRWQAGDVVFWDNRCSMHCALNDYSEDDRRLMWRTTIAGDVPI
ncbi:MAG: TauD/TfdA dioxygenase family protein [Rhodospirillales bacterium]|jgi:taurine dioxygenase